MEFVEISMLDSIDPTVRDVPYEHEVMEPQFNLTPVETLGCRIYSKRIKNLHG